MESTKIVPDPGATEFFVFSNFDKLLEANLKASSTTYSSVIEAMQGYVTLHWDAYVASLEERGVRVGYAKKTDFLSGWTDDALAPKVSFLLPTFNTLNNKVEFRLAAQEDDKAVFLNRIMTESYTTDIDMLRENKGSILEVLLGTGLRAFYAELDKMVADLLIRHNSPSEQPVLLTLDGEVPHLFFEKKAFLLTRFLYGTFGTALAPKR